MKPDSLESIISDMVRRLDVVRPEDQGKGDPLSEVEAFTSADPILAALHKQYLEANVQHKKLIRENGLDDPMAEIAADMLDSARSAVQTRLLELQDTRTEEVRETLQRKLLARQARKEVSKSRELIKKRRADYDSDLFFWIMVFYWLMTRTIFATRKRLSAANDFALVSSFREQQSVCSG